MYNPDYPSESYGWSAFTFQPYDQPQQQMYYNGGVNSPFAASTTIPTGSRRQLGQEFANQYNSGAYQQYQQPTGYGFAQSPYAPAYQQAPTQYPYGAPQQPAPQPQQIAPPLPPTGQPSLLSPQAFQPQNQLRHSTAYIQDRVLYGIRQARVLHGITPIHRKESYSHHQSIGKRRKLRDRHIHMATYTIQLT